MVSWMRPRRYGPIGIDLGSRSVKLVQFNGDQSRLLAAVRWELPDAGEAPLDDEQRGALWTQAVQQAREAQRFRGREAVICLGSSQLCVQNVRVAKGPPGDLERAVQQEVAGRLPFPLAESEWRYWQAADVRQGDVTKREVIVLACHRPVLERALAVISGAGLRPVAVDAEPAALLRGYARQLRRDDDRQTRTLYVHVGATSSAAVIARDREVLFVKYLDVCGRQMDEAVKRHLKMSLADAIALRRNNGDRRVDLQDPEVTRTVAEAVRPVVEQLATEVSRCVRYHSVAFRGQPLARLVLGGGEASPSLLDALTARCDLKCELGDPLRSFENAPGGNRRGQWDVACGLALRTVQ
jgi:type IV pilus assembly protein PilM